jgi:hypothetical protein
MGPHPVFVVAELDLVGIGQVVSGPDLSVPGPESRISPPDLVLRVLPARLRGRRTLPVSRWSAQRTNDLDAGEGGVIVNEPEEAVGGSVHRAVPSRSGT